MTADTVTGVSPFDVAWQTGAPSSGSRCKAGSVGSAARSTPSRIGLATSDPHPEGRRRRGHRLRFGAGSRFTLPAEPES